MTDDDDLDRDLLSGTGSNDEVRDRGFAESRITEDVRVRPALIDEVPWIAVSCLDEVDVDRRRDMGFMTIFSSGGVSISSTALAFATF